MKKPALLILGLLLLALISTYYIIPQNINAKSMSRMDATDGNVARFIVLKSAWKKWWPGQQSQKDSLNYQYKSCRYQLQKSTNGDIEVQITKGNDTLHSKITYQAIAQGETEVTWLATQLSSINPFARIAQYTRIKGMQSNMDEILASFRKFMQDDARVYGIAVEIKKITVPLFITTAAATSSYPTMETVYKMIAGLQQQVTAKGAKTTGSPMLNVNQTDENEYSVMVALPINKPFTTAADTKLNEMVVGGNLLQVHVKGGKQTIANAFAQLKNYQKDHSLVSPAMPFETLVTNRLIEKDTAKWETTLYWPIF